MSHLLIDFPVFQLRVVFDACDSEGEGRISLSQLANLSRSHCAGHLELLEIFQVGEETEDSVDFQQFCQQMINFMGTGEEVDSKLKSLGYENDKEEIEEQLKVALEAYTMPTSEERKIVMSQEGGLRAYLELCKHHDLRTDATANKLRGEIMELGKQCKTGEK